MGPMSEAPPKRVEQDVGKAADERFDRRGKKLKQIQTKKPQRGQKKTKNKAPDTRVTGSLPATKLEDEADSVTPDDNSIDVKDPAVILPPKKSRASKKRKDGYDPDQLSSGIVVPSVQRLAAAKQATIRVHDVVQRPAGTPGVSKRQQEINQLKRRFPGLSSNGEGRDCYNIPFVPSDPDFPYELPELLINLLIPEDYPQSATILRIQAGLEVGFARNVERSFENERVGFGFAGRGLLGMLTWLDRNLERILGMKKSDTIKIVRPQIQTTSGISGHDTTNRLIGAEPDAAVFTEPPLGSTNDEFSAEQLQEASNIRRKELSNLRLIHPSKIQEDSFLLDLSPAISVHLQVPQSFPLKSAWLMVVKGDHKHESAANQILKENKRGLGRTINWLSANWHKLTDAQPEVMVTQPINSTSADITIPVHGTRKPEFSDYDGFVLVANQVYQVQTDGEDINFDEDYSSGDDFDDYSNLDHGIGDMSIEQNIESGNDPLTKNHKLATIGNAQEKGTAINTAITLTYISLLEPLSLSLNLKCLRCKSSANHIESVQAGQSSEVQCPTCSSLLTVGFRGQALHVGNSRIGYLDLVGASVLDLGPGTFSPTCEKCDVVGAAFKGLVAGQPQTRPCRACHIKQSVAITSTSFLVVNSATKSANQGSRDAQNLNLQRGKALPNNGVCKHYRKSNRWFRFGCCNKVYACDHCHDSLTDHPMELARFQICGWCSKESAIRGLKPCVHCGRDLTRRSRGGYWEGGQGTRDQSKMNRNDPRKYRKKLGASSSK